MFELVDNLFIGTKEDFWDNEVDDGFKFCIATKTLHRQIAMLDGEDIEGYAGNMSKDESEYLIAERPERNLIACNLIDAPMVEYIPDAIINRCLEFVEEGLAEGYKVLVLCDKAQSRSVAISFMHLIKSGYFSDMKSPSELLNKVEKMYPYAQFGKGIEAYFIRFIEDYFSRK